MSRLFGVTCNEPERLRCALYASRDALVADAAPDGWGLAFYQGGEVLLQRHPKPAGTVDFYQAVQDLRSDYVIGQVREPGAPAKLENTQPYRFRSWVFAHHGLIDRFEAIQAGMLESIPDYLRRNIRGQTDSEHLFHLFLAFLHDEGKLDDPNLVVGDAQSALRATAGMLDRLLRAADGQRRPYSVILSNGRILMGMRQGGGKPMWVRRTHGIHDCPLCRSEGGAADHRGRRVSHEALKAVLIASEPKKLGPEGWEEVPEGSLVSVARDLTTSIVPLAQQ
jgi:glutamine amidotransferase